MENGTQKISVGDEILKMKSDSITVDMEAFSHLTNKDPTFNSRFNLHRSLSRKGSQIGEEKKNNPSIGNEGDPISSPKAHPTLEKPTPMTVGSTDTQVHHQITIVTGSAATITTPNSTETPPKNRPFGKRSSSFKQTPIINPKRILVFFATLSSMGTILLIYFTLSMAKYNGEDNVLD